MQFDVGDLEDSGRQGAIARKEKEIKEKEQRQLTGLEGKSLYLEALQLILRHQLRWLIREKGHSIEIETVVRDLWDLRVRAFSSLVPPDNPAEEILEVFNSLPQLSNTDDGHDSNTNSLNWDPGKGSDWPMPRLMDTLSLCYLGCLLLRCPTRIGEFLSWANGGNMPYTRVVRPSHRR